MGSKIEVDFFGDRESVVENKLGVEDQEMGIYSIRVVVPGHPNSNVNKGFQSLEKAFEYFEEIGKWKLDKLLIVGYSGTGVRSAREIDFLGKKEDKAIELVIDDREQQKLSKLPIDGVSEARTISKRDNGIWYLLLDLKDPKGVEEPILGVEEAKLILSSSDNAAISFKVKGGTEISEEEIARLFSQVTGKAEEVMGQLIKGHVSWGVLRHRLTELRSGAKISDVNY